MQNIFADFEHPRLRLGKAKAKTFWFFLLLFARLALLLHHKTENYAK